MLQLIFHFLFILYHFCNNVHNIIFKFKKKKEKIPRFHIKSTTSNHIDRNLNIKLFWDKFFFLKVF